MEKKIKGVLRKSGLTDGEIRVYVALLELGTVTVGPIIDKAQISSSKVYIILEKLIKKGLVSYIVKKKTKYFQASPAHSLLDLIKEKEKEITRTREEVKDVIGEIDKIRSSIPSPEEAKIYKGLEGLKTAWSEAIKSIPDDGTYYFFSFGYSEEPYVRRFFTNITKKMKQRGISIKGIANKKERSLYKKYFSKYYKVRFTTFSVPADTTIAGDYLLILVWDKKEPVVYSISSRALVQSYLHFFEDIWKTAKK